MEFDKQTSILTEWGLYNEHLFTLLLSTQVKDEKIRVLEEQLQEHHAKASNAVEEVQVLYCGGEL